MAKNIERQINLLERYNAKQRTKKKEAGKKRSMALYMTLIFLVLVAALFGMYYYFDKQTIQTDNKLSALQAQLLDSELIEKRAEAEIYMRLNALLIRQISAAETVKAQLSEKYGGYDYLVPELYARLDKLCGSGTEIVYYYLDNNTLVLSLIAQKAASAAEFVLRAEESGLFFSVAYNGFSSGEDEDGKQVYSFTVQCGF